MTSRRERILAELVRRTGAIPGVDSFRRGVRNETNRERVVAWSIGPELPDEKQNAQTESRVFTATATCALQAELAVADAADNAFVELDKLKCDVYRALCSGAFSEEQFTLGMASVMIDLGEVGESAPEGDNVVAGTIAFRVRYQHDTDNPDTIEGEEV